METSPQDLRVAFVGSVVSDAECGSNPICNTAGNKFQRNFVASLRAATGKTVDVISFIPAAMFPKGKRIRYSAEELEIEKGQQPGSFIGYLNLPLLKQATQALAIFVGLARWHWRHRSSRRVVIVYNVFAPHALPVLAARFLFGGRAVALVADMPHDFYDFSGLWGYLQRIEMVAQTRSIARFDGHIGLTKMITADFAPSAPAILLEGGVDASEATMITDTSEIMDARVILFSGTLNEINGTRLMLDAFELIEGPRYRLRVFGRGPVEDLVVKAADRDPRIEYPGFRPNAEIVTQQRRATVLLNPRPSHQTITRYSFPSKLLEYMLSGRPVITTRLAGIPPDYAPHLYFADDESPEGLATSIRAVCEKPEEELAAFGRAARDFVLRNKTWTVQGERVYEFISFLAERGAEQGRR